MNNKGQTNGLVTGLVFGIASLVVLVIIAFVIVSTLIDADLLTQGRTTNTVTNETGGFINATGYTLDGATNTDFVSGSFTISEARNHTAGGTVITSTDYTVSADGVVTNATATTYADVNFDYTNTVKTAEELSADRLNTNFTEGVDNISEQIPTVLLIAAIILILAMLAILVGVWTRMRMGEGGSL